MGKAILEVENLTFRYDKRYESNILSNVSFSVDKGEWLAIVGNNGSGKSTLAKILIGLLVADQGSIRVNGRDLIDSKWEIRQQIGLVFQNTDQFIGTTVEDDIAFGLENINMPYAEMEIRVNQALELMGLTDFRFANPSYLSGGQKQRVAIAGILALRPHVLVLDESFVMLDPTSRRKLIEQLHQLKVKENVTIISITHDMDEAARADRIMELKYGKVIRIGTPSQIFSRSTELEQPFAEKLKQELKKRNRNAPNHYITEGELINWLCK